MWCWKCPVVFTVLLALLYLQDFALLLCIFTAVIHDYEHKGVSVSVMNGCTLMYLADER